MDSREIVNKTLCFENPERVARSFFESEFISVWPKVPNPKGQWVKINNREWERIDEWGNTWRRIDDTSKGEIVRGVLEDINDVETIPLPDFSNPEYYQTAKKIFIDNPDKYHIGGVHGFAFSIARKMRKLEQYLVDLILEREKIHVLQDRIDRIIMFQIRSFAEAGADAIIFCEDWGTQTQTLISPSLWRNEFKPRFIKLCSFAHGLGLKVFMHSCGKITDIIPDLIKAGIDLLQFDQPRLHDIDTLKEMQRLGKITFWCPIDIQTTLQTKDEKVIIAEVNELLDKLWSGRGGFVAGYYGDNDSIGLDPKWQQIACEEFIKRGVRKKQFI